MTVATIGRRIPPQRLITFLNPVVRGLLASPLHVAVDAGLLTLHVTGRRTGHRYDIPVGYAALDGRLFVVTQHRWRANLRGGQDVEITHRGRRRPAYAEVNEEPASVGVTLRRLSEGAGWHVVRRLTGLTTAGDRSPALDELQAAARAYDLAVVTLTPEGAGR